MKLIPILTALALTIAFCSAQGIKQPRPINLPPDIDITVVKDTGKQAVAEVLAAFAAHPAASGSQSYIILPLTSDIDRGVDGAVTLRASISVHNVATGEKTWGDEVTKSVPGRLTTQQWVMYGAIALGALGVLVIAIWFALAVRKAARPR